MIAFVQRMEKLEIMATGSILSRIDLDHRRYKRWCAKGGEEMVAVRPAPKEGPLTEEEKALIVAFYLQNRRHGYRRCAYMMQDRKLIGVAPSTVYAVLKEAGALRQPRPQARPKGFKQPSAPHHHWHIDFTSFVVKGCAWHLISIIDGYSRCILAWGLFAKATQGEAQLILQKAIEKHKPETLELALISDNGSQFKADGFQQVLKKHGIKSRFTSPYHPQSNGKIERWHKSLKHEAVYPGAPVTEAELRAEIARFVESYNKERLHCAVGYIAPADVLAGKSEAILERRRCFLVEQRRDRRQRVALKVPAAVGDGRVRVSASADKPRSPQRGTSAGRSGVSFGRAKQARPDPNSSAIPNRLAEPTSAQQTKEVAGIF